jgi:DNA-binding transcriptional ArsR family regulator
MREVPVPKRNGAGIDLLADPTRRRIVGLLAVRPRRPSSLAADIGRSRPATSRQLHLLRDAGLIIGQRSINDGRVLLYRLNPSATGAITAWLVGTDIGAPYRMQLTDSGRIEDD